MTVKELIEELKGMPQDALVVTWDDPYEDDLYPVSVEVRKDMDKCPVSITADTMNRYKI